MFRLPSWHGGSIFGPVRCDEASIRVAVFLAGFSDFFGNTLDEAKSEVLAGTLSPKGKLFEIYFVRLIGTPNQEILLKLVVQKITRF
jgi:hypothetical protein